MQNTFDNWKSTSTDLAHYGVLGMKWGERRYQNADGSLTAAGKERYRYQSHATKKYEKKAQKALGKAIRYAEKHNINDIEEAKRNKYINKQQDKYTKYAHRASRSADLDYLEQRGARNVSTGKAIATRLLLNGDMSKAYHQNLAMMGTSVERASTGQKTVARINSYFGGTYSSRIMKAAYIRKGEGSGFERLGNKIMAGNQTAADQIDKAKRNVKKSYKKYT